MERVLQHIAKANIHLQDQPIGQLLPSSADVIRQFAIGLVPTRVTEFGQARSLSTGPPYGLDRKSTFLLGVHRNWL